MDWALDNFHAEKLYFIFLGTTSGCQILAAFESCSVITNRIPDILPDLNIYPQTRRCSGDRNIS